ncbi:MAG: substrate-binding domain-containing protein [Pseudorhodoplanes sp.]|nr:substrate-binding domain-containing protein [Pseudorhodoplanes sp.]
MSNRLLAILLLALAAPAHAETLRVGGSGAATILLQELFAAAPHKETTELRVLGHLGTGGALRALSAGALDLAIAGRPLTAQERDQGLRAVGSFRAPYVLVTSHPRPNGLRSSEIASLYVSPRPTWSDGSMIRVILRPKSESDTAVLGETFPGMKAALASARARHDVPIAATDQDNLDAAESIPSSLAGSTLLQVTLEQRNLRLVPIDGASPSVEALESGLYPYGKTFYVVLPAEFTAAAARFAAFINSPAGETILRNSGAIRIVNPGES